jgi:hypothetical protein
MSDTVLNYAQFIAHIVTILGLPAAIISYMMESSWRRRDRENGTYSSLDDKYLDYLQLCVDHPELEMFDAVESTRDNYEPREQIQRYAMFETLISIFERAYLMMQDHSSEARRRQWRGWEEYLKSWSKHPDFPVLWEKLGGQFDSEFVAYVKGHILPSIAPKPS